MKPLADAFSTRICVISSNAYHSKEYISKEYLSKEYPSKEYLSKKTFFYALHTDYRISPQIMNVALFMLEVYTYTYILNFLNLIF